LSARRKNRNIKDLRRRRRADLARSRQASAHIDEATMKRAVTAIFGKLLHHKQVLSIGLVALGVVYSARMTVHAIGTAMARARCRVFPKHGIKQVDRFMSNAKIKPVVMREGLVRAVVGNRKAVSMTMDWTDFDANDQTVLAISLVLRHGRAIPLVWTNVRKSTIKGKRAMYERTAVQMLREALPRGVHVTLMADRGFGDTKLFDHLAGIPSFDFIVRFKKDYTVIADDYRGKAKSAIYLNGRPRVFKNAKLTGQERGPYNIVLIKARGMKDSWCLATSLDTIDGRDIVSQYGRRFECEESFRDLKDWRFGMALKHTKIGDNVRRERLLFVFALAAFLLTLVGAASEQLGLDRFLRANTSRRRTHSLFRQGREIVSGALPDELEQQCMHLVMLRLETALEKGFCHALA
jgi:hypothetical protein